MELPSSVVPISKRTKAVQSSPWEVWELCRAVKMTLLKGYDECFAVRQELPGMWTNDGCFNA